MPAPSLYDIAKRLCIRHIKSIVDVGDAPYAVVRCVLVAIENAEQLRQIELASPQICGEDAELWKNFIKRDVPDYQTKQRAPSKPKEWYQLYRKLITENEAAVRRDAEAVKAAMEALKAEKAKLNAVLVDDFRSLPGVRKHLRQKASYGKGGGGWQMTSSFSREERAMERALWKDERDERAEKAKRKDTLAAFRKNKRPSILSTPTHLLGSKFGPGQIRPGIKESAPRPGPRAVPQAAAAPCAVPASSSPRPVPRPTTRPLPIGTTKPTPRAPRPSLEERERRLRVLTSGVPQAPDPKRTRPDAPASQSHVGSTSPTRQPTADGASNTAASATAPKAVVPPTKPAETSPQSPPPSAQKTPRPPPPASRPDRQPASQKQQPSVNRKRKEVDIFNRRPTKKGRVV